MARNYMYRNIKDQLFDISVYVVLIMISAIMLYPLLNAVAISLSSYNYYLLHPMMIFPRKIDLSAFILVFTNKQIFTSYGNTLFVTISGTALAIFLTTLTAYPLSRKELRWKRGFMTYFVIVMVFQAGIIPEYLVIAGLGMYNSLWALIVPFLMPIYHLVLMKTFFESVPDSMIEAAKIDGAHELYIYIKVILPLSKAAIAAIGLFQAILFWNDFFKAVIFLREQAKWPLQLLLREIINSATAQYASSGGNLAEVNINIIAPKSVQYASLVVVILPIICVYPFIQKYFVKGVMIGAVKE
ncbi:MAG: ABC transporter permease [Clostridiales bacterium GWC2_40_7]|nr:MAG: ABC transporter permease [Clostridiales bacterium GWC2_40_7]